MSQERDSRPPQKNAPPTAVPAKKTPPGEAAATKLKVWHVPVKNTRIVVAYRPGADPTDPTRLVTVNVRDNRLFMPEMTLTASKVSEAVYDLIGPLPRWRGRW